MTLAHVLCYYLFSFFYTLLLMYDEENREHSFGTVTLHIVEIFFILLVCWIFPLAGMITKEFRPNFINSISEKKIRIRL